MYDCYSALHTDYDEYHPVLKVDYRDLRDDSCVHLGLRCHDPEHDRRRLFPKLMTKEDSVPDAPAVDCGPFASPSRARLDVGNDVFVAYDRRAREDSGPLLRVAPVTGRGPVWIPEAASCLTSKGPVHNKIDRWVVDTGCGYDLVSRDHISWMKRWIRKAVKAPIFPEGEGITATEQAARMTVGEFGEEMAPCMFGFCTGGTICGVQMYESGICLYLAKRRKSIVLIAK